MSDPVPVSAISTAGTATVSAIGSNGSGGGKIMSAAELRAAAESYSADQVDTLLGGYLPLTGGTLTGALSLGSNALTCGAITASGNVVFEASPSSSGEIQRNGSSGNQGVILRETSSGAALTVTPNRVDAYCTNGFRVSNTIGTTDGPLVCSAITSSGNFTLRNGLTAMTADIFETYTSSTNYGSLRIKATSSGHQIGSARGTSGSNRAVQLGHFDSAGTFSAGLSIGTTGSVSLPVGGSFSDWFNCGVWAAGGSSTGIYHASGLRLSWTNGAAWNSSAGVVAIGRASDGVLGIYASETGSTLASLSCSAITASGNLDLTALPTSDPGVPGRVWVDGTTLKISV